MSQSEREQIKELYSDCSEEDLQYLGFNNDEIVSIKPSGYVRGDGGATNYYELPKGATELRHLIHHKKMEHGIGEAFCSLYRLNDNGEYLRNLKKAKYYIDCAIEYEEGN